MLRDGGVPPAARQGAGNEDLARRQVRHVSSLRSDPLQAAALRQSASDLAEGGVVVVFSSAMSAGYARIVMSP